MGRERVCDVAIGCAVMVLGGCINSGACSDAQQPDSSAPSKHSVSLLAPVDWPPDGTARLRRGARAVASPALVSYESHAKPARAGTTRTRIDSARSPVGSAVLFLHPAQVLAQVSDHPQFELALLFVLGQRVHLVCAQGYVDMRGRHHGHVIGRHEDAARP